MMGRSRFAKGKEPPPADRIPREVRDAVLLRLEQEGQRYINSGDAVDFDGVFRGRFLYIAARQRHAHGGHVTVVPLCRLEYTGDLERWRFQIFRFSSCAYDEDQDFPFSGGSPEDCLAVAADFYLREYDALRAGSSREEEANIAVGEEGRPARRRAAKFVGMAKLLPKLSPGAVPSMPKAASWPPGVEECSMLADSRTFVEFVSGSNFPLAPRTLGFGRRDLGELNALMRVPQKLHSRIVQHQVPRIQCCFAVAEGLGLLEVRRPLRQARGTSACEAFLKRPAQEQWWMILEALWHRVSWEALRPTAFGHADIQQAGRRWLGEELARHSRPLCLDEMGLTYNAEVLEVFLFPFFADAGLVRLSYSGRVNPHFKARSTGLREVKVTDPGPWAFAELAKGSPPIPKHEAGPNPEDGQWSGRDFWFRLNEVGCAVQYR
jgi:hypothetical protein